MKTRTWWFSGLVALGRMSRALVGIERQLTRIADAHEGLSPKAREVPDADAADPPKATLEPASTRAETFTLVDSVERMLTRAHGRPPTPEEIVHELDELEWGAGDLTAAQRQRLGL